MKPLRVPAIRTEAGGVAERGFALALGQAGLAGNNGERG